MHIKVQAGVSVSRHTQGSKLPTTSRQMHQSTVQVMQGRNNHLHIGEYKPQLKIPCVAIGGSIQQMSYDAPPPHQSLSPLPPSNHEQPPATNPRNGFDYRRAERRRARALGHIALHKNHDISVTPLAPDLRDETTVPATPADDATSHDKAREESRQRIWRWLEEVSRHASGHPDPPASPHSTVRAELSGDEPVDQASARDRTTPGNSARPGLLRRRNCKHLHVQTSRPVLVQTPEPAAPTRATFPFHTPPPSPTAPTRETAYHTAPTHLTRTSPTSTPSTSHSPAQSSSHVPTQKSASTQPTSISNPPHTTLTPSTLSHEDENHWFDLTTATIAAYQHSNTAFITSAYSQIIDAEAAGEITLTDALAAFLVKVIYEVACRKSTMGAVQICWDVTVMVRDRRGMGVGGQGEGEMGDEEAALTTLEQAARHFREALMEGGVRGVMEELGGFVGAEE